jgi:two-component system, chemotaxis family, chemotaxis protein CheY
VDDANDGAAALAKMRAQRGIGANLEQQLVAAHRLHVPVRDHQSVTLGAETPFIMVTAESKTDNVIAARKADVNNYIVKPFNAQTLRAKIETVFTEAAEPAPAA